MTDVIIAALVDLTLMRQSRYFYCSLEGGHDFMGWGFANLGKEFENCVAFSSQKPLSFSNQNHKGYSDNGDQDSGDDVRRQCFSEDEGAD